MPGSNLVAGGRHADPTVRADGALDRGLFGGAPYDRTYGNPFGKSVMKVRVDGELCHGHQMCAIAAPEVFGSDDFGNAVVLIDGPIPAHLEAATRRAQGNCPERAVLITDD
jgi:ferredoxin